MDVALECRHAAAIIEHRQVEDDLISVREPRFSSLEVRRDPASITLEFPDRASPEALVHPLLSLPLSILARWRGDLTLHAGAFYSNDRAWAVIGDREAGKSTMLAKIAEAGCPLLADDLLVLDGNVVRAGPACIDLRPDAAERIPNARYLGEIGSRPRHRLSTAPGPARAELGGFFLLGWDEDPTVRAEPMPAGEALRVVYDQEYFGLLGPGDPQRILELLDAPMWRVARPQDWSTTDEAVDRILETTAGVGG